MAATLGVAERLRRRLPEIEQATLLRVSAVAPPPSRAAPEYVEGLRAAVAAALRYGIDGIDGRERDAPPVPLALLGQARLAAVSGVGLDTVMRRYVAGHILLVDFLMQEARELPAEEMKRLVRRLAATLDVLLAAVSNAYEDERGRRQNNSDRRRAELVERLLAGEPLDTSELSYDFGGWHLGLCVAGLGGEGRKELDALAAGLGARLLAVRRADDVHWAWLGTRRRLEPEALVDRLRDRPPARGPLAFGEPGSGMAAWGLTHRQARAALSVALRVDVTVVRYVDVALTAALLQDDLLATSLRQQFLLPLSRERDGGETLRETLRAYFDAGGNVSSTATVLEVSRQTVASRLRTIEAQLGHSLTDYSTELAAALRLEEIPPQLPDRP